MPTARFSFVTKTPPAAVLLKKAAGIEKGSGTPNKEKKGKVTEKQVREIATQKMPDLNAASMDAAIKSIKGTARSMGIEVVGIGSAFRLVEQKALRDAEGLRFDEENH